MSNRPKRLVHQQTVFGDDSQLEVIETSVKTSFEDSGAEVDHRDCESRRDQPAASEFGIDDRPEVTRASEGDQATLFAEIDENQQTIAVNEAAARCLFEE
ncbi:hypothetical protein SAMN04487948_11675 [Halogranum amylolyticum]|uniref:Uncharacterized protein n=1 Tax=Halogranum amylolyticum TaxID=660520 RepID=A0A1H8VG56_9EURY|nr:hypothetical protein [Halogranum amylolyticum]SEP14436.1 hypothetical protein SAMN04487948_11675 [Halogranum amylolyticum]